MKLNVNDIVEAVSGELVQGGASLECNGVAIDSRTMNEGDLFMAIRGLHFDGHDFIPQAIEKGARVIVASHNMEIPPEVGFIRVADTERALGELASWWRGRYSVPCVAITGSNGKSTTKEMIASIVSSMGQVLKTEGNYNNLIGLPLTVLRWRDHHDVAVLEMGMNAPGEISTLTCIARPDVGVVTNVTAAHLEKLRSVEQVAKAKAELFEAMEECGIAVVNDEDQWVRAMGERFSGKVISFGMRDDSTVQFRHMVSEGLDSTELTFRIDSEERTVHIPIPGAHNVMNALAAFAVGYALGLKLDAMIDCFERFRPMSMRFECVQLTNGVRMVNDSYNANPESMCAAFRTVGAAKRAGRFVAVLGDMFELGEQAPELHREVGEAAAQAGVSRLFIIGEHAEDVARGAERGGLNNSHVSVAEDMDQLSSMVIEDMKAGDVVLVKGSRGMRMERLVEYVKREIGTG
jgi:UDP-N-acetylmuramoyl-tripeptide--D-alanyl-D-alanine ligase